jgi:hypothetical protein
MISPPIDAPADSDIMPALRRKTLVRKRIMITTEQLNVVAAMIGTTDKNLVFTACIKTLVEAGMDVKLAMEFVLGKNNVDAMIGDLYDGLRAQA